MSTNAVTVGAVAYHPRVVTIWDHFDQHFATHGVRMDHVLCSTYEQLVDALLAEHVHIAWNTNTAFIALGHRLGQPARILGMRDIDANFASVLVTRRDADVQAPTDLARRRLGLGSRDCGHAAILPLHFLREAGLDAAAGCQLRRQVRDGSGRTQGFADDDGRVRAASTAA